MMNICISFKIKLNGCGCTEGTNLVDKHCWIRDWKGIEWIAWIERFVCSHLSIKGRPEKADFPYFWPILQISFILPRFTSFARIWVVDSFPSNPIDKCFDYHILEQVSAITADLNLDLNLMCKVRLNFFFFVLICCPISVFQYLLVLMSLEPYNMILGYKSTARAVLIYSKSYLILLLADLSKINTHANT